MGSPVLVVDEQELAGARWYRLFAADGTNGWTRNRPVNMRAARVAMPAIDALDQGPDSDSGEGPKTIRVKSPVVTGASRNPSVSSPQHLSMPEERNWLRTPLLNVQSSAPNGPVTGWVSPGEIQIESGAVRHGLVRFLFVREKPVAAPVPRQFVARVGEDGETVTVGKTGYMESWTRQEAEFVASNGESLAIVPGGDSHLMRVTRNGVHRFLIFEKYKPLLQSAALADLNGDGINEWLVEIVQLTGDGHRGALWVLARGGVTGLQAFHVDLGSSSGETGETVAGAVIRDRKTGRLWTVQSDTKKTTAQLVRLTAGRGWQAVQAAASVVHAGIRATRAEAVADALARGDSFEVFPVASDGRTAWAAGRLFRTEAESKAFLRIAKDGASLAVFAIE